MAIFGVPTVSTKSEGNIGCIAIARGGRTLGGQRPRAPMEAPHAGTERSHAWPQKMGLRSVPSIPKEQDRDERMWEVRLSNITWETSEQRTWFAAACGGSGGKGTGQGESDPANQIPNIESARPAT